LYIGIWVLTYYFLFSYIQLILKQVFIVHAHAREVARSWVSG
jgi:hypothetical protein